MLISGTLPPKSSHSLEALTHALLETGSCEEKNVQCLEQLLAAKALLLKDFPDCLGARLAKTKT